MNRPLRIAIIALAALPIAACGHHSRPNPDLAASKVTTIGVNSYLWRASLDTLSFMPLLQTDSNGGVIVTDWYQNPKAANERMKVTVLDPRPGPARRRAARGGAAPGQPGGPVGRCAGAGRDRAEAGRHHPDARA